MGLCWSCCGRRKPSREKDPLLPKPPPEQLAKLADITAAVRTGKLPSQKQADLILTNLLNHLTPDPSITSESNSLVLKLREAVAAFRDFARDKNYDDVFQDVYHHAKRISQGPSRAKAELNIETNVSADLPNLKSDELFEDLTELVQSSLQVCSLLIRSTAFRKLLSDVYLVIRQFIADGASDVAQLAQQIDIAATDVQTAVESPELHNITFEDIEARASERLEGIQSIGEKATNLPQKAAGNFQENVFESIQKTLVVASRNPAYTSALSKVFMIFAKYLSFLEKTARGMSDADVEVTPHVTIPADLHKALDGTRTALERLASGHSLRPLMTNIERTFKHLLDSPESFYPLQQYLSSFQRFLNVSITRGTSYLQSPEFMHELEHHVRFGKSLFASQSNEPWVHGLKVCFEECQLFLDHLADDGSTSRVISAFSSIFLSGSSDVMESLKEAALRKGIDLYHDLLTYLVPRLLRAIQALPMPRFEFIQSEENGASLECALDALLVTAHSKHVSLAPDDVLVRSWNEVRIEIDQSDAESHEDNDERAPLLRHSSHPARGPTSRLQIQLSGIRISVNDVGYFVHYNSASFLRFLRFAYGDSGLLSVLLGSERRNSGLTVNIDVERKPDSRHLFEVHSVQSSFSDLTFSLDNSHHWILNKFFLVPLARPIVRLVLSNVVDQQLTTLLRAVDRFFVGVVGESESAAPKDTRPDWVTYFETFWSHFSSLFEQEHSTEVDVESSTRITLKGVVHTTVTRPADEDGEAEPTSTTTIAVGIGPQILPPSADLLEEAQSEALAQETITDLQGGISKVAEEGVQFRQNLDGAADLERARESEEKSRIGWRSNAFDL